MKRKKVSDLKNLGAVINEWAVSINLLTVYAPELQSMPFSSCLSRCWRCWEHGFVPGRGGSTSAVLLPFLCHLCDQSPWTRNQRSCLHPHWSLILGTHFKLFCLLLTTWFPCCGPVPGCLRLQSVSFWRPGRSTEQNDFSCGWCLLASPHLWFSDTLLFRENFMSELFLNWFCGREEGKAWLFLMLSVGVWGFFCVL